MRKQQKNWFQVILARFSPNLVQKFFSWISPLLDVICIILYEILLPKPAISGWKRCDTLLQDIFVYAISRKTNEPNLKKGKKTLVLGPILVHLGRDTWTGQTDRQTRVISSDAVYCWASNVSKLWRYIKNTLKHLGWSFLRKMVDIFILLTIFTKSSIL